MELAGIITGTIKLLIGIGVLNGLLGGWDPTLDMTLVGTLLWLPIGCAAAALGGWLRDCRSEGERWLLE